VKVGTFKLLIAQFYWIKGLNYFYLENILSPIAIFLLLLDDTDCWKRGHDSWKN